MTAKQEIQKLLSLADVKINGNRPWDIKVHDEKVYNRVLTHGSLGLGESYMDGWWDCRQLDELFNKMLIAKLNNKIGGLSTALLSILAKITNLQSKKRAFQVGEKHYDLGNDLFKVMLDKRMTYSCAYWKDANTLENAQEAKLDLICRKLKLKPGMKVLDLGCGWGSFAKYAAERYNVKVVGITVAREQEKLAKELCKGLPVDIRLQDYRDLNEQFDAIVSLAMFEAVGVKNFNTYMEVVHRCLKKDGLFLLHTIGANESTAAGDPWSDKYIFPNGMLPSIKQIASAIEGLFVMEDWHNFGYDYYLTLMEWHKRFNKNWKNLKSKYDERFFRMWNYYLLSFAGAFKARYNQLWQIVLSKNGVPGGYESIR